MSLSDLLPCLRQHRRFFSVSLTLLGAFLSVLLITALVQANNFSHEPSIRPMAESTWGLIWNDEFGGTGGVNTSTWIYDVGTSYPGGPPNWGTHEVEVMTNSTNNVFQSGGNLNIRALHAGTAPTTGWTAGRLESVRTDFRPPISGLLAVEARIQLPDVTGAAAQGYWPAFWMLGAPYRGNYWNWPGVGEIDIMENINGNNEWVGTFHCGVISGGPCYETVGRSSGPVGGFFPPLQKAFHIYRFEWDRRSAHEQFRWYVDGVPRHTVNENDPGLDAAAWVSATNHGFFIILNVAMGGDWPGYPTSSTVSGGTMLIDYVRVYVQPAWAVYLPVIIKDSA